MGLLRGLAEGMLHRLALRRWSRIADGAAREDPEALRLHRTQARALRGQIDRLLRMADARLAAPRSGAAAPRLPLGTDWNWRPEPWAGAVPLPVIASAAKRAELCEGITLFHDCDLGEIVLRQIRNARPGDPAPHGLQFEVFRFTGTFLSIAIDLPGAASSGISRRHLFRLEAAIDLEWPTTVYARLNVRQGPNTEQQVRALSDGVTEFDLAYTGMVETRVEKMWVDLIFEGPGMNRIILRDVTLSRRPRAEL
ncbi:DUF6478 family protein [Rhodobacter sp. NSM]|uniref:DUF6478 family protein n=1 Tax=Rhodobacter sp. NSM TaxID=3457501 RepID=UPI003FD0437A